MRYIITTKDVNKPIKDFLLENTISRKALKAIKQHGKILVNGKHQTVRYLLHEKDCIEIEFPIESSGIIPSAMDLDIYFEDADFLVINKPSNLPCIPTKRYPTHTLANAIMYYYQQHDIKATVHLVNRLDKDTQGLLLVAKSRHMHSLLSKDIKQVERIYQCVVEGRLQGSGVIETGITKDVDSVKRLIDESGKLSITKYQVLSNSDNTSLVECQLLTGRTHQIRVHMAYLGHPLVGDTLYGSSTSQTYYLDSISLSFIHPVTKKRITIKKSNAK